MFWKNEEIFFMPEIFSNSKFKVLYMVLNTLFMDINSNKKVYRNYALEVQNQAQ